MAPWHPNDVCSICYEKGRELEDGKWNLQLELLKNLVGQNPNSNQTTCLHDFRIIPKSGRRFGTSLWGCDKCEKVVQSS